jgi:DNA-binding XRE family transcriptional regulator
MAFEFIEDLDAYFCEKYANYDRICILRGYEMPKMQTSKRLADGTERAYTLPASTMRLALQKNKAQLLASLKEGLSDESYSFSFRPLGFFTRIKNKRGKQSFPKTFKAVLARHNETKEGAGQLVTVDKKTWDKICSGAYAPTKNLLFSLALVLHLNMDDMNELFSVCGFAFDYALVKDVVLSYLITRKVFNGDMVRAALAEYKVDNLFVKTL